jgi:tRNA pseudouridine55 synthase
VIVPVDKPPGLTSASCVRRIGRAAGLRAGHAGTLDPDATGLLVICLGESRKLVSILTGHDKAYSATIQLGWETDTLDGSGVVVNEMDVPPLDIEAVRLEAQRLTGRIRQVVPVFSAVKRGGKPLHRLARAGADVDPPEREVIIHDIDVRRVEGGRIDLQVSCGPGTYIRSLARDLAGELGTVGHLCSLRRMSSGSIPVEGAPELDAVVSAALDGTLTSHELDHAQALEGQHLLLADRDQASLLRSGRPLDAARLVEIAPGLPPPVILDQDGYAVCIAASSNGTIRPRRVLLQSRRT